MRILSAEKDKMVGGLCHVLVGFRTPIPSLKPCEKHGMIFSGALGVHSDVYIYLSLLPVHGPSNPLVSQTWLAGKSPKEMEVSFAGKVISIFHPELAPVASQVRKAFANFMCGAPDFKNWNPKIGISIVNDLQIDFLTIGTCLPDS